MPFSNLCKNIQHPSALKHRAFTYRAGTTLCQNRSQSSVFSPPAKPRLLDGWQLPAQSKELVDHLRAKLTETANNVDAAFPDNEHLKIEDGEPVLQRVERRSTPENLSLISQLMREQMPAVSLLDAMMDTEKWLNWTRHFGPLSGHEAKLDEPIIRYLTTVFTYGCNLGPSQLAQAMREIDRYQIAWVNQRHISEEALDKAITEVINGYNRFLLPSLWGSGERASADGTKWDLYEQNLLSEYHIRYGGYGGIAYYLISDKYIAKMIPN